MCLLKWWDFVKQHPANETAHLQAKHLQHVPLTAAKDWNHSLQMRQVKGSYMCQGTAYSLQFKGIPSQGACYMSYFYKIFVGLLHLPDSHHRLACQTGTRSGTRLCCNQGVLWDCFVDITFCILPLEQHLLPKCSGLAKNHLSCCSQLSLLLFESFYCFPIFSILALSLLSLLPKSHLIQILSLVHLCYYLLYPFYVIYSSLLNFIFITT